MNSKKPKPDPSAWKSGAKKLENGGAAPHRAYVPPALAKAQPEDTYQGASALRTDTRPDLPQKLVDEFKA